MNSNTLSKLLVQTIFYTGDIGRGILYGGGGGIVLELLRSEAGSKFGTEMSIK